jgi:hypothetical protein
MRRARPRVAVLFPAALAAAFVLGAWQWPVAEVGIDVSFGEPSDGGVSPGLKIVSQAADVETAASGELVFGLEARGSSHAVPHGLGSFVVLEHEGGFRSLYAHLDRADAARRVAYGEGDPLGTVGQTGFSGGNTLGFRLIDTERRTYVNPMLLLPELPDDAAPRVEEVALVRGDERFPLVRGVAVPTGSHELEARIYDPGVSGPYRGDSPPYAVTLFVNGQQRFSVALETLGSANGRVAFAGGLTAAQLYGADGRLRLGRVTIGLGNNLVEIIAEDYAGNERIASFRITGENVQ